MKVYLGGVTTANAYDFMLALQISVLAVGLGLTLRHPYTHKAVFSITFVLGKWSIGFGLNGRLQ